MYGSWTGDIWLFPATLRLSEVHVSNWLVTVTLCTIKLASYTMYYQAFTRFRSSRREKHIHIILDFHHFSFQCSSFSPTNIVIGFISISVHRRANLSLLYFLSLNVI
uniref:Uncharacterized protein n=1 Tax=Cacopsylla melanoneura TaxID=428564 RepID=A0A8D8XUL0_9HEMI